MSIGKPPSAVHDYAQRPARRRDAFIALWTDDLRAAHEPLLRLPAARRAELRWAHLAVTIAVAERGGPLPPDDQIAARAVGEDVRTFRAWRQALDRYGLLVTSPAGWSTRPADDELCRRAARALRRHAPDTAPTLGSVGVDRGQNPRDISGRAAPPAPLPPPPSPSGVNHDSPSVGGGRAREGLPTDVAAALRALVAQHVGEAAAGALLTRLEVERARCGTPVRDEIAWALGWLKRRRCAITPAALATAVADRGRLMPAGQLVPIGDVGAALAARAGRR